MKCDRRILVPFGRDGDLLKLVNNNNQYAYMYMSGSDGPRRAALKGCHEAMPLSIVMEVGEEGYVQITILQMQWGGGDGHGGRGTEVAEGNRC